MECGPSETAVVTYLIEATRTSILLWSSLSAAAIVTTCVQEIRLCRGIEKRLLARRKGQKGDEDVSRDTE
jgi:hypothetical protein